jgi:hypothetical protein
MSHKHKERDEVYAVLRFDAFLSSAEIRPEVSVTVKEILRSRELAEAEVERLNRVKGEKDVRYWWQQTRLFPEGGSACESST